MLTRCNVTCMQICDASIFDIITSMYLEQVTLYSHPRRHSLDSDILIYGYNQITKIKSEYLHQICDIILQIISYIPQNTREQISLKYALEKDSNYSRAKENEFLRYSY